MNTTANAFPAWRTRLSVGLALVCLTMLAGCGNDLSEAKNTTTARPTKTTRTTESATDIETTTTENDTGGTTTTDETTTTYDGSSHGGGSTGLTLPDGTGLTLPEGVDLTIPDGLGECVEAGAALTELSLGALGVSSIDHIDRAAATLEEAFGPGSSKDIDIVAKVAREAAEGGQINPGAAGNKASTKALEKLTDRLSGVCGVG